MNIHQAVQAGYLGRAKEILSLDSGYLEAQDVKVKVFFCS